MRWGALVLGGLLGACSTQEPAPVAEPARHEPPAASREAPSCREIGGSAWPRPAEGMAGVAGVAKVAGQRRLTQMMSDGRVRELAFVGAHAFDLLDKLAHEASHDGERRRVVCHVLNDAAERGVKVLRLWGSLKRTGSDAEVEESTRLLALVFDENARRTRPLLFVVTLLNHQAGYGAPDPARSLDDQAGAWGARALYVEGAWDAAGGGSLGRRIDALRRPEMASPHVIAWELVNELDTFRHVAGGTFAGADGAALRERFLVPAATCLARAVPQPIMLGDIRGQRDAYAKWAPALVAALPEPVRRRLVWTSHVYGERGKQPDDFLRKLDVDLAIARDNELPFVLGELGQHVPGAKGSFCGAGVAHELEPLLAAVTKRGVDALFIWGEGRCDLDVGGGRRMIIGAGSDSAEIGADDGPTLALLRARRR